MSNINKQAMDIDLSRFNRSGSVYSPISKIGSSSTSVSKRLQPTQTSTPLTRNSPWQKNSSTSVKAMTFQNSTIHRSPRYSLSSSVSSTPKNQHSASTSAIQTVAGPLLASTRFNINLGTYTDTKSPGLAGRVVQYHNETQANQSQTHQAKYGSPGQFPIVQLYKKELPLLTRIPRRCTVRIAPPDSVVYNSTEANAILRETFVQPNAERTIGEDTEINTKSVLDALKEISRKRIHANDDIDDISKRQRKDSICTSTSSDNTNKDGKRLREDTPPKPKGTPLSPGTSIPKKICVTNEIECSLSSSVLMRLQGQKRKATVGNMSNVNKQRRIGNDEDQISKETQTNMESSNTVPVTHSTQTNFTESVNGESAPKDKQIAEAQTEDKDYKGLQTILQNARRKKKEYHEKTVKEIDAERTSIRFDEPNIYKPLFNPEPLDIIRKNRLEVAMAAFNGEKPEIIPLPQLTLTQMKENFLKQQSPSRQISEAKSLPSILSPKNKTKHDKHVTFDIPNTNGNTEMTKPIEANNNDNVNTDSSSLKINFGSANLSVVSSFSNSQTSSINETVKSSSFALPAADLTPLTKSPTVVPTPQNSPVSFALSTSQITFPNNNFNFNSSESTKSPFAGSNTTPKTSPPAFGAITTTTVSNNTIATPGVNDTIQPSSSVNFGSTQNTVTFGGFGGSNVMKSPAFGGLAPSAAVTTPNNISTTSSASGAISLGTTTSNISFGFSANNNTSTSASVLPFNSTPTNSIAPPPFPQTSLVTTSPSTQPSLPFGSSQPVIAFGSSNQPTTTSATGSISFGTPIQTNQSNVAFGTPTTSANTGIFGFGAKTETTQPTTTQGFTFAGSKPTSSPAKTGGFKFDLGKSPAAPNIATTVTDTQNKPSVFGDTNMNKATAFAFGATNNNNNTTSTTLAAAVFGTPTVTTSVFGVGTTAPPAFGTPKTTENPPGFGTFGTVSTCQSSSFGTFNTPTTTQNTPGFGGFGATQAPKTNNNFAAPTTTSNFNFGNTNTTNKPFAFNAATTTTNTNAPNVFGTPSSTFGTPTPSGTVFGAPTTTAAIVPSGSGVFGTPSTTTSTSNVFGTPTTTSSVFGPNTTTTTANAFGQQSGVFGGTTSGFGAAPTNGSAFGTPNNTFASTGTANAFGVAPNQAPFGTGATQGVFGGNANNQTNAFASPNNNRPPAFGSTSTTGTFGGFGASNTSQPTATSGFGNNTTQSTAIGGFGTNTAQPTASSGFGTSTAQPTVTGGFGTGSAQPTSSGVFGTATAQASAASAFGATSNQTAATSAFGTTNAQPAAGFGGFGGATSQAPAQQSGIFAFGNATPQNATPAAPSNAFQFGGQPAPAKSGGFNFSGGASTPNINFGSGAGTPAPGFGAAQAPGFGTPNTGMFSIGSGSTVAKQRPIIKARRRNN